MIKDSTIADKDVTEGRDLQLWILYSWGLFRPRTKLCCRKCGMFIGHAYEDVTMSCASDSSDSSSGSGTTSCRKYNVKIRALQPSDETDASFLI